MAPAPSLEIMREAPAPGGETAPGPPAPALPSYEETEAKLLSVLHGSVAAQDSEFRAEVLAELQLLRAARAGRALYE